VTQGLTQLGAYEPVNRTNELVVKLGIASAGNSAALRRHEAVPQDDVGIAFAWTSTARRPN